MSSAPLSLARQVTPTTPTVARAAEGGGGGGGGGADSDAAFKDLLRRVREEQEQLGQLIKHPF